MSILSEMLSAILGDLVAQRGRGVCWFDSWRQDLLLGKHCRAGRERGLGRSSRASDVAERMGKTALLKALKEHPEEGSSRTIAPPSIKNGKRKTPLSTEKEVRRRKKKGASISEVQTAPTTEMLRAPTPPTPTQKERPAPTPPASTPAVHPMVVPEVPAAEVGARTEAGPVQSAALNIFEDSFVVSPSCSAATGLLCNMIPDRDIVRVQNAPDSDAVGSFAAQFAAMVWGSEVINRLTRARREEALTIEKKAVVAEFEALAEGEIQLLKGEAENAWGLGKEEFLKSSEFDDLCAKKSLAYFDCGFKGYLAQFQANEYLEEEHQAPFLSMARA
ncbi:hypothetical protein F511_13318 [Dorcoceras hygrometricum]|uniref:Uncharacterized protein n=1 Tax=Dorcoceras hygrometricum TaxID=472368 RepID=A0A2Z7DIH8_9LAMI|nr:hypothetical protein F511_13318 [Dorcoceras hygrometricum]